MCDKGEGDERGSWKKKIVEMKDKRRRERVAEVHDKVVEMKMEKKRVEAEVEVE